LVLIEYTGGAKSGQPELALKQIAA
jgi:hypothetical protein